MTRQATITRKTKETIVECELHLDGTGRAKIDTGIGFFDHMLHHLAFHGLFDLNIKAQGDLHVDEHHTIEDVGIVFGQALAKALDDRKGITRMGVSYVPMDEALARVVVDLSGRPYTVFEAEWDTPLIGSMPTSLVEHIFESIAFHGRLNLHAKVFYGRDDHHKAEALFKAFGRSLRQAVTLDPARADIPSTKGTLTT